MIMFGNMLGDQAMGANVIAGALAGAKCNLFKANITPNRDTTLATLLAGIADFQTYAAKSVTWSAVTRADDGSIEFLGSMTEWRPTSAVNPNTVYGFYLTDTAGAVLLYAGRFEGGPLPMGDALDSILLTLRYRPKTEGVANFIS